MLVTQLLYGGQRMRKYSIYLIEEEFASHYFGRESIVYNLFLDFTRTTLGNKSQISKQIEFITCPIQTLTLHQVIEKSLQGNDHYRHLHNTHYLQFKNPDSSAKIKILDRCMMIEATGSYEAETYFFEILRKYNPFFLAMEFNLNRYGWLKPIKERKFV